MPLNDERLAQIEFPQVKSIVLKINGTAHVERVKERHTPSDSNAAAASRAQRHIN